MGERCLSFRSISFEQNMMCMHGTGERTKAAANQIAGHGVTGQLKQHIMRPAACRFVGKTSV